MTGPGSILPEDTAPCKLFQRLPSVPPTIAARVAQRGPRDKRSPRSPRSLPRRRRRRRNRERRHWARCLWFQSAVRSRESPRRVHHRSIAGKSTHGRGRRSDVETSRSHPQGPEAKRAARTSAAGERRKRGMSRQPGLRWDALRRFAPRRAQLARAAMNNAAARKMSPFSPRPASSIAASAWATSRSRAALAWSRPKAET